MAKLEKELETKKQMENDNEKIEQTELDDQNKQEKTNQIESKYLSLSNHNIYTIIIDNIYFLKGQPIDLKELQDILSTFELI